jgi:hypothetical protein
VKRKQPASGQESRKGIAAPGRNLLLLGEQERERLIERLADAEDPLISAATLVEASIVMLAKNRPRWSRRPRPR